MVELEDVTDVAIKHTSVGGNNCHENHTPQHVTQVTTREAAFTRRNLADLCERHLGIGGSGARAHSLEWPVSQHENNTEPMT